MQVQDTLHYQQAQENLPLAFKFGLGLVVLFIIAFIAYRRHLDNTAPKS